MFFGAARLRESRVPFWVAEEGYPSRARKKTALWGESVTKRPSGGRRGAAQKFRLQDGGRGRVRARARKGAKGGGVLKRGRGEALGEVGSVSFAQFPAQICRSNCRRQSRPVRELAACPSPSGCAANSFGLGHPLITLVAAAHLVLILDAAGVAPTEPIAGARLSGAPFQMGERYPHEHSVFRSAVHR